MFNNITELMRKKHVGVDLIDGKLIAFEINGDVFLEKPLDETFPNMLNNKNDISYWYNFNSMKQIFTFVINKIGRSLYRPSLYITIPFEISKDEDKRVISEAALKSRWGRVHIISNLLCSSSGLEENEFRRKIYIYSINNITYIGLIFAGGAFNVNILQKGYMQLTITDIENSVHQLLGQVSTELPEQFTSAKLSKKNLEEVSNGWSLEIEKKLYISAPSELKSRLSYAIGEYELVYLDYENCILEGLKKLIQAVQRY